MTIVDIFVNGMFTLTIVTTKTLLYNMDRKRVGTNGQDNDDDDERRELYDETKRESKRGSNREREKKRERESAPERRSILSLMMISLFFLLLHCLL